MAHRYSNFTDAFDAFTGDYAQVDATLGYAYNLVLEAYDEWADPVTKPQVFKIRGAVLNLVNAVSYLASKYVGDWQQQPLYESIYWLKQEAGGVDMDAIIYAMLTAEPDEVLYFIGLVDAFRQSVWNLPYNQEFFAAIARGFNV